MPVFSCNRFILETAEDASTLLPILVDGANYYYH